MIKKINNKKGSTLVLLVMAIAVISILGTSVLGVTMMNYKIKKTNTDLKYSFYMSESGLDKAYAATYSLIIDAVAEANKAAQEKIDEFDYEKLLEIIEGDDELKKAKYLIETEDGIYNFNQSAIKDDAKKEFEAKYKDVIIFGNEDLIVGIENTLKSVSYGTEDDEEMLSVKVNSGGNFETFSYEIPLVIPISSTYYRKNENITKTTDVDLVIKMPKYNEAYTVSTADVDVNPFWTKALTANNLYINNNNDTIINGEVFLSNNLYVENNGGKAEFTDDLAVRNNINIGENAELSTKNVYAKNILLGYEDKGLRKSGKNAKFTATEVSDGDASTYEGVVVLDDLEMNDLGQIVEIDGSYYGFGYGGDIIDNTLNSAIIINNENIDMLNIKNLYLLGTSYIKDLVNPYATGESLSITGNYVAYSVPMKIGEYKDGVFIPGEFDESKVVFDDNYDPLPPLVKEIIDEDGKESVMRVDQKAGYLEAFSIRYGDMVRKGGGKIILSGNIETHGAYINKGEILKPEKGILELLGKRDDIKNTYESKIKHLGYGNGSEEEFTTEEIFDNIKALKKSYSDNHNISEYNEKFINLKGTELLHINYVEESHEPYEFPREAKTGLVITNEDIVITGGIDFTGVIICGGDITIESGVENNKFVYSKGIVTTIIADNNLHETVFKDTDTTGERVRITTFAQGGDSVNVNFSNLLKFENWNIK